MLRLTKKADYGLMALKYLAEHAGQSSLSAKDVAEAYRIPPQLLAKILQQLAREGLLRSHAGMNGGYTLARAPESITAFEVIRIIDGPLFITSCVTDSGTCDLTNSCTIKEPLARVNDSISDVLKKIRISDLVEAGPAHAQHGSNIQELVTIQGQIQEKIRSEVEPHNA
jgi:Rrf2 family protein